MTVKKLNAPEQALQDNCLRVWRVNEEEIKLCVRPKPRWMPRWVWMRLLARSLYISSKKV